MHRLIQAQARMKNPSRLEGRFAVRSAGGIPRWPADMKRHPSLSRVSARACLGERRPCGRLPVGPAAVRRADSRRGDGRCGRAPAPTVLRRQPGWPRDQRCSSRGRALATRRPRTHGRLADRQAPRDRASG